MAKKRRSSPTEEASRTRRRSAYPEPLPALKRRVRAILKRLAEAYPEAKPELNFSSPLELLVATILSAQCTDERVNQVTAQLFREYRTAADYADADLKTLESEIRPTGYYRQKARTLKSCCQALVEKFNGQVPASMEELLQLPGVGRKTANVVLGAAFGIPSGVVVDTHVQRVARRLGLTAEKNPEKIEQDLMRCLPKEEWIAFGMRLILHGRRVCLARKPKCDQCVLASYCPRIGVQELFGRTTKTTQRRARTG
jgi:endonuclease-3